MHVILARGVAESKARKTETIVILSRTFNASLYILYNGHRKRFLSGNKAKLAKILCYSKLPLTHTFSLKYSDRDSFFTRYGLSDRTL